MPSHLELPSEMQTDVNICTLLKMRWTHKLCIQVQSNRDSWKFDKLIHLTFEFVICFYPRFRKVQKERSWHHGVSLSDFAVSNANMCQKIIQKRKVKASAPSTMGSSLCPMWVWDLMSKLMPNRKYSWHQWKYLQNHNTAKTLDRRTRPYEMYSNI